MHLKDDRPCNSAVWFSYMMDTWYISCVFFVFNCQAKTLLHRSSDLTTNSPTGPERLPLHGCSCRVCAPPGGDCDALTLSHFSFFPRLNLPGAILNHTAVSPRRRLLCVMCTTQINKKKNRHKHRDKQHLQHVSQTALHWSAASIISWTLFMNIPVSRWCICASLLWLLSHVLQFDGAEWPVSHWEHSGLFVANIPHVPMSVMRRRLASGGLHSPSDILHLQTRISQWEEERRWPSGWHICPAHVAPSTFTMESWEPSLSKIVYISVTFYHLSHLMSRLFPSGVR